jgi:hypothetical protein
MSCYVKLYHTWLHYVCLEEKKTTAPPKNTPTLNRNDTEQFEKLLTELHQVDKRLQKINHTLTTQTPTHRIEKTNTERILQ